MLIYININLTHTHTHTSTHAICYIKKEQKQFEWFSIAKFGNPPQNVSSLSKKKTSNENKTDKKIETHDAREREMKVIIEKRERNLCVAHFRAPPKSVILCYKHHHILSQETRQLCMKEKERKNKLENRTLLQKNKRKYNKKKKL